MPAPSADAQAHSERLAALIRAEIAATGGDVGELAEQPAAEPGAASHRLVRRGKD